MIRTAIVILISLLSVTFSGCYYDVEEELYPRLPLDSTAVTYTADIAPLISSSCSIAGCHVEGGIGIAKNIKLDTYQALKVRVDDGSFRNEVIVNQSMPPSFTLNPVDLQKIQIWLDNGAPNN